MIRYLGEIAALATAATWAISAVCWTAAGRKVGSLAVNTMRLFIALPMFLVYCHFANGEAIPLSAPRAAWFWLGLSGITGFFICDLCLFQSFLLIGTRRAMLIFALTPIGSSIMGSLFLDESLTILGLVGMLTAIAGVIWVIMEAPDAVPAQGAREKPLHSPWGISMAFMAMLMQAIASILSKIGLRYLPSSAAATEIRLLAGLVCFALLVLCLGRYHTFVPALKSARTMGILLTGTIAGPFLGVTFLMFALQRTTTALAMTFLSLTPIFVMALTVALFKERVSLRAFAGALVAFFGLALMLFAEPLAALLQHTLMLSRS